MPQVRCPMCSTVVQYADGFSPVCSNCGYAGPLPNSAAPHMVHSKAPSTGVAIAALLLNVLIWPGLGTMIGGRFSEGLLQGFLFLLGALMLGLLFVFIIPIFLGGAMMFAMWVWGIVSGVQLINQAGAAPQAQATA